VWGLTPRTPEEGKNGHAPKKGEKTSQITGITRMAVEIWGERGGKKKTPEPGKKCTYKGKDQNPNMGGKGR